jgi:outer membrane protein assembly factor BamC
MTNRKNFQMDQCNRVQRGLILALALTGLGGCTSFNSMMEPDRIDYKSASKGHGSVLEIPPDLTQLQRDSRYAIPEADKGMATASGYSQSKTAPAVSAGAAVAPRTIADMRIERAGTQRWLVVRQSPEVLWPKIKDFWQDNGFLINIDAPEAGVMETDWAENRAKIPQDFIRNSLGKLLDSLYSTGERDKFRTRLERNADGTTEIFVSHRGAQEVLTTGRGDSTVWTARPSDPELEAEFLARMMARLGLESARAKATVVAAVAQPMHAKLVRATAGNYVEVDESFDRAWRRVGLALDRVGFTVEDRDRNSGMYFVRYVDQGQEAEMKSNGEKGFLSRLFSFGSGDDKAKSAQRYRVSIKEAGTTSKIVVLNNEGRADLSATADKILSLLNDQLK